MEIKPKLYPYPVLAPRSNAYRNCMFDARVEAIQEERDWHIAFLAALTSESLLACIGSGSAQYVYHLECARTGFRTVTRTGDVQARYTLPHDSVHGVLEIVPLVVAVEDIKGYSGADFHEDYEGLSFDIEAGCVMAVGRTTAVEIAKDVDDLAPVPSIFNISKNPDADARHMLVDIFQRKIVIKLPASDYYHYKALTVNTAAVGMLRALIILPALLFAFGELRSIAPGERGENENFLWYRSLRNTLLEQFDCDIDSPAFDSLHFMEIAQELLEDPLTNAFQFVESNMGADEGDEL